MIPSETYKKDTTPKGGLITCKFIALCRKWNLLNLYITSDSYVHWKQINHLNHDTENLLNLHLSTVNTAMFFNSLLVQSWQTNDLWFWHFKNQKSVFYDIQPKVSSSYITLNLNSNTWNTHNKALYHTALFTISALLFLVAFLSYLTFLFGFTRILKIECFFSIQTHVTSSSTLLFVQSGNTN